MTNKNHSHLAMKASRRIARSKQKEQLGHTICYHLLMMIEQGKPVTQPRRASNDASMAHYTAEKRKQFSLGL
jgi:hypothetical protein